MGIANKVTADVISEIVRRVLLSGQYRLGQALSATFTPPQAGGDFATAQAQDAEFGVNKDMDGSFADNTNLDGEV
jgi:hypothetical protein